MKDKSYTDFLVNFQKDSVAQLYSDWQWLIASNELKEPIVMSCFGDLFFKRADGHIFFLDTLEGTVSEFAADENSMSVHLGKPENQSLYLSSENVELLQQRGLVLKDGELYTYVPHPEVSGSVDLNSVQVMTMQVALSINGQLLGQRQARVN